MSIPSDAIVERLDAVIDVFDEARREGTLSESYVQRRLISSAFAAISRYAPKGSVYANDANKLDRSETSERWKAEQFAAIAHALRDDYAFGDLTTIEEVVHASLFDDFIDMATELLEKGYLGPAVVLAGSVLEEHLRKLAGKNGVESTDSEGRAISAERLGVELRKVGAYSEVQRKGISAWYSLRNEAAHGPLSDPNVGEVARMLDGIRDFVARNPA